MAETNLRNYTVQEKLNKMDIDLIDVTLTTVAAAISNNEVISQSIEIPNAVAVNGGSAIIQSVMLLDEDDEAPTMELLFSQSNTAITNALSNVIGSGISPLDEVFRNLLGSTVVSDWSDIADAQMGVKKNIGLVIKAASDSKSIYVHTINRSGGDYTPAATTDLKLRIGIVKD